MTLTQIAALITLPLLGLAVINCLIRLAHGPRMPDRVVALDLMATLGIGIIAVFAIANEQAVFLDTVTILALLSFLGTVAFAYYLQKRP
jgi:multicomponent Na+:H+ antiporter subunit F